VTRSKSLTSLMAPIAWPRLLERIKLEAGGAKRLISQDNAGVLLYMPSTPRHQITGEHLRTLTALALGSAPPLASKSSRFSYLALQTYRRGSHSVLASSSSPLPSCFPSILPYLRHHMSPSDRRSQLKHLFALANMRAGYAREFMMDIVACYVWRRV